MFLNAVMLAGIGAAVVPLVLHLLNRARYRSVEWGAMMFLYGDDARQRQSARLKQLVLLLLRMTLVAALAVCFARPVVHARWSPGGQAPSTAVVLLDRSASTGFDENGRPRFAQSKAAVVSILATLHKGDEAAVLTMGDAGAPGRDPAPAPTADLHALAAAVEDLTAGAGPASVADGLNRAAEVLARARNANRRLFVVCDRQASSWAQVNDAFAAAWKKRVARSGVAPAFVVVPVGSEASDNVAVEKVQLTDRPAIRNRPADVEVTVHNYGGSPRPGLPLSLTAGGREIFSTPLTLGPGAEEVVHATVKFPQAGSQVLEASVRTAGLAYDDQYACAVDVLKSLPVLLVSGSDAPGTPGDASGYVALALAPFAAAKRPGADLSVVAASAAGGNWSAELGKYRVVILADVPQFTPSQVKDLEAFAYGGGGVLIAPGGRARVPSYDSMLYNDGAGLMPASLRPATPPDGSAATSLLGIDLSHPVFRFLKGKPDFIPTAAVARYFPAVPRRPDGRVLASYVSGEPFLVGGSFGRGRVLLVTTPLDADWGALPLSNFFLPFVQSSVKYLAAAEFSSHNLSPGEPLVATFDEPLEGRARLVRPDGVPLDLPLLRSGDQTEVRYTQTDAPGQYRLDVPGHGQSRTQFFVVQRPPGESDLTPLSPERWKWLSSNLGFRIVDPTKGSLGDALAPEPDERELWPAFLAAVIALVVGEVAVERLWSREEL